MQEKLSDSPNWHRVSAVAVDTRRSWAPWISGILLVLLGALSAIQHWMQFDLGIAQYFRPVWEVFHQDHLGRMSVTSSLALVFLGLSQILTRCFSGHLRLQQVVAVGAIVAIGLSGVTLVGAFAGQDPTVSGYSYFYLPLPIAVVFAGASLTFLSLSLQRIRRHGAGNTFELPLLTSSIVLLLSILLAQYLQAVETHYVNQEILSETRSRVERTHDSLRQVARSLTWFASRVGVVGASHKGYLIANSKNYIEQLPTLRNIGMTDAQLNSIWSYPDHDVSAFSLKEEHVWRAALREAQVRLEVVVSGTVKVSPAGLGNLIVAPISGRDGFRGTVYGIVKTDILFRQLWDNDHSDVRILDSGRVVFASPAKGKLKHSFESRFVLKEGLTEWELVVTPTEDFVSSKFSDTPKLVLFFGCLLALIVGGFLRALLKSHIAKTAYLTQLEHLVNGTRDHGICLLDRAGYVVSWNLGAERIKGYKTAEVKGCHFSIFYTPEDQKNLVPQGILESAVARRSVEVSGWRVRKDGTRFWANVVITALYDQRGHVKGFSKIMRDMTEIRNSQQETELFFKLSLDLLAIANEDGSFARVSPAVRQILGYTEEEFCSQHSASFLHPEDAERTSRELENEKTGNPVVTFENRYRAKDGSYRWLSWKSIRFGSKFYRSARDVTQLKDSERSLKTINGDLRDKLEERNRANQLLLQQTELIVNSLGATIWAVDLSKRFIFFDGQAIRALGMGSSYQIGKCIDEIADNQDFQPHLSTAVQRALVSESSSFEFSRDGRWFETQVSPLLDSKGVISGAVGISLDVTERKLLQDEKNALLVREKAALEATKLKSEFLANMSHEIRTPINGVVGMAGLLLDTRLTEEQRDFTDVIRRSAENLLTIVNDVLDFSKVEAGKLDLEVVDFDLQRVIEDTEKTLAFSARQKNLAFSVRGKSGWDRSFKGDHCRLRQVLTNLVSNAIKFTSHGRVVLRILEVSDDEVSTQFRFEVSDTGIGIPQLAMDRMFQSFTQAESSISRRFGGTGLGLAISKKIVQAMGGEIGVESQEGVGSTFWFTLKLDKGSALSSASDSVWSTSAILRSDGSPFRVLVAEDNPVNQRIALAQLRKMGLRADAVANGNEVIDALRVISYDLILMDCQMPEVDGYEATRRIRQSGTMEFRNVTIVAMTASAMKGDREKCLSAGMDDYLAKPIDIVELGRTIEKWLRRPAAKGSTETYRIEQEGA